MPFEPSPFPRPIAEPVAPPPAEDFAWAPALAPPFPSPVEGGLPLQAAGAPEDALRELLRVNLQQMQLQLDAHTAAALQTAERQRQQAREEAEATLALLQQERRAWEERLRQQEKEDAEATLSSLRQERAEWEERMLQQQAEAENRIAAAVQEALREASAKQEADLEEVRQEGAKANERTRTAFRHLYQAQSTRLLQAQEQLGQKGRGGDSKASTEVSPKRRRDPPSPPPESSLQAEERSRPKDLCDESLAVFVAIRRNAELEDEKQQAEVAVVRLKQGLRLPGPLSTEGAPVLVRHWDELLQEPQDRVLWDLVLKELNFHVMAPDPFFYGAEAFFEVMPPTPVPGLRGGVRYVAVAGVRRVKESLFDARNPGGLGTTVWEPAYRAPQWFSGLLRSEALPQCLLDMPATASVEDEVRRTAKIRAAAERDTGTLNAYQVTATRAKRKEVARKSLEKVLQENPHDGAPVNPSPTPAGHERDRFFDRALCEKVRGLTRWAAGIRTAFDSSEITDALTPAEGDREGLAAMTLQDLLQIIVTSWNDKSTLKGEMEVARTSAMKTGTESKTLPSMLSSLDGFLAHVLRRLLPKPTLLRYTSQLGFLRAFPPQSWTVMEAYRCLLGIRTTYSLLVTLEVTAQECYKGVSIILSEVESPGPIVDLFIAVIPTPIGTAMRLMVDHVTEGKLYQGATLDKIYEKALEWEHDSTMIPQQFATTAGAAQSRPTAPAPRVAWQRRPPPRVTALEGEALEDVAVLDGIEQPRGRPPPPPPPGNPPQSGAPTGGGAPRLCWNCGSPDHIARNCPQAPNQAKLRVLRSQDLAEQEWPASWADPHVLKILNDAWGGEEEEEVAEDPSPH